MSLSHNYPASLVELRTQVLTLVAMKCLLPCSHFPVLSCFQLQPWKGSLFVIPQPLKWKKGNVYELIRGILFSCSHAVDQSNKNLIQSMDQMLLC